MPRPLVFLAASLLALGGQRAAPRELASQQVEQMPSSYELIDRALAARQVTVEDAYKYRVFAAFGDTRLPSRFRGDDIAFTEVPSSVLDVGRLLATFSPQTQAELAPFFMPPGEPGSWLTLPTVTRDTADPRDAGDAPAEERSPGPSRSAAATRSRAPAEQWHTVLAAGGKVKVWAQLRYRDDSAKAEVIAREVTTTIWPELVRFFWEPLSDSSSRYDSGGPELDIFLVRPTERDTARIRARWNIGGNWRGFAGYSSPWKCSGGAFYLLIRSDGPIGSATSPGILQDVAHELTHAITGKIPLKGECKDYNWIREATATWAEHWVYPNAQSEHERAWRFFVERRRSLDKLHDDEDLYAYGSYLFPLHLMLHGRRERAIPEMWRQFATHATRPGINAALQSVGTSLDSVYPEFAVQNLNRATADDYRRIDGLIESIKVHPDSVPVAVGRATGKAEYEREIFMGMHYLSAQQVHFDFDASVKTITFDNTLVPIPYASVWGIEKIKGSWKKPVDWSKEHGKTWCRDVATEDLEALVLVFTNNEWRDTSRTVDPGRHRPTLRAHAVGCIGWTGTTEVVNTITSADPNVTIVETVQTTMRLAIDSTLIIPGKAPEHWKTVGGHMTWRVQVTGTCSGSAQGSVPIVRLPDDHVATLRIWSEGGKLHYSGSNGPWPGDIPTYTIPCTEGPVTMSLIAALGFFQTDSDKDLLAPDGKSFSGNFVSRPSPGMTVHHRYSFRCAAGC